MILFCYKEATNLDLNSWIESMCFLFLHFFLTDKMEKVIKTIPYGQDLIDLKPHCLYMCAVCIYKCTLSVYV